MRGQVHVWDTTGHSTPLAGTIYIDITPKISIFDSKILIMPRILKVSIAMPLPVPMTTVDGIILISHLRPLAGVPLACCNRILISTIISSSSSLYSIAGVPSDIHPLAGVPLACCTGHTEPATDLVWQVPFHISEPEISVSPTDISESVILVSP